MFLRWPVIKNPPAMQEIQEAWVPFLGQKDPWRRAWHPTPVFLPEESHEQRSLANYNPWSHKESDTNEASEHAKCVCTKLLQSYLTLYDSIDCSLPDSSVYGILQARILEWGAISPSRESCQPRD